MKNGSYFNFNTSFDMNGCIYLLHNTQHFLQAATMTQCISQIPGYIISARMKVL